MNPDNRKSSRMIAVAATMFMVLLVAMAATAATPTVTLTPNIDPPSPGIGAPVVFQVSGANFPISTAVDIYFDLTDVALAVTSSTGAFSGINVQVPTTAVPGTTAAETGVAMSTVFHRSAANSSPGEIR